MRLDFLNIHSIQNYIDKGGASGFTKPKPAYLIAEIIWLSTKYHEQALDYNHIYTII
jgi:hypothetical protein